MTATELETTRELTAQDRCDACSAAASVIATLLNGELMFCGHHARKNADRLKSVSINIFDPQNSLNALN
jgi:hypothetical protein